MSAIVATGPSLSRVAFLGNVKTPCDGNSAGSDADCNKVLAVINVSMCNLFVNNKPKCDFTPENKTFAMMTLAL